LTFLFSVPLSLPQLEDENGRCALRQRIALEAIKEQKTIQEIASHYGVHPSQVTNWKRQAIQGAPELFADRRSQPDTSEEALKAELYQQIGQLQVELDWLKKKSGLSR
jgi:transposase-like protein